MTTAILAIVCIVLIFVLYIVSGGWKKYGGFLGVFKWLCAGAQLGPVQNAKPMARVSSPVDPATDEAIRVLKDMYQEFDERTRAIEARLDKLEASQQSLERLLKPFLSMTSPARPIAQEPVQSTADDVGVKDDGAVSSKASQTIAQADVRETPTPVGDGVRDDLYYVILDMLEAGRSEAEIASELNVQPEAVDYVREIMSIPVQNRPSADL
ncbi:MULTISPECIES: hypothetical protein [Alicyclobacillus]|uniref:Uncharacterized protein n=1 Tax=Alicyclobacillus acidoterrestris (strain ATCC 49025 / DSM 3922 / CIP 106132 / NCIMB 13137 / GD3B) TaxID=1356854 RepID=T0D3T5_ALIAG|nr:MULTISPECIES: hypothetical protein [Alicyclobacillus]EPZ46237.1 hypothetical protein N007_07015 [Alicyclobacillus acidoterrestris ATCC 49025]UNO47127.1 hypothetical protein K1I37_10205 [Alicyclobacillus acidoterrestris]